MRFLVSLTTTVLVSRQACVRPSILKSDHHHHNLHHHQNGSAPQTDSTAPSGEHHEPRRRVSIVVEDPVATGLSKKLSTCSCEGRVSLRSMALDSAPTAPTKKHSTCSCGDNRSTKSANVHESQSAPPTPPPTHKQSALAAIPISTISGKHELGKWIHPHCKFVWWNAVKTNSCFR